MKIYISVKMFLFLLLFLVVVYFRNSIYLLSADLLHVVTMTRLFAFITCAFLQLSPGSVLSRQCTCTPFLKHDYVVKCSRKLVAAGNNILKQGIIYSGTAPRSCLIFDEDDDKEWYWHAMLIMSA